MLQQQIEGKYALLGQFEDEGSAEVYKVRHLFLEVRLITVSTAQVLAVSDGLPAGAGIFPAYASPEQFSAAGEAPVDARTDLYSVRHRALPAPDRAAARSRCGDSARDSEMRKAG